MNKIYVVTDLNTLSLEGTWYKRCYELEDALAYAKEGLHSRYVLEYEDRGRAGLFPTGRSWDTETLSNAEGLGGDTDTLSSGSLGEETKS